MRVVYSYDELSDYLREIYGADAGVSTELAEAPLLIDRFLEAATEVDVDAVYDGTEVLIGGIMEHVEEAGVHSGDSACVVPPPTIAAEAHAAISRITEDLAAALGVRGLINLQFAVKGTEVFLIEANPRASRTVPFISKAMGLPLAKIAARVMVGASLARLRAEGMIPPPSESGFVAVKEAVLPWWRFPEEDVVLGPEMRATGEVMGIGGDVGIAYAKALRAAGHRLPRSGTVFISLADRDKAIGLAAAQAFAMLGFRLLASSGTARYLEHHGVAAETISKIGEGPGDAAERIEAGEVDLVINTPRGRRARSDGRRIRQAAHRRDVPCVTTVQGALAVARSLQAGEGAQTTVRSLQAWHT
jgi:carbamoyl-phosphate synthase large subunit